MSGLLQELNEEALTGVKSKLLEELRSDFFKEVIVKEDFGVELDKDGFIPYFALNNAFDILLTQQDFERKTRLANLIYKSWERLPEDPINNKTGYRGILDKRRQDMLADMVFLQKYPQNKKELYKNKEYQTNDVLEAITDVKLEKIKQEAITLKKLLESDIPEPQWIIEKILTAQGIAIFGGDSGHGKSFIAQLLALACSRGTPFLGKYNTSKERVLYIDEESTLAMLKQRFLLLANGQKITDFPENLIVLSRQDIKLNDDVKDYKHKGENSALFREIITSYNPGLVIIDSMIGCMIGSENDSDNVRGIFNTLKPLLKDGKFGVIILHHTSKSNRAKTKISLRGSGDFVAFADSLLMFNKRENTITISWEKARMLPESEVKPIIVELFSLNDGIDIRYKGELSEQTDSLTEISNAIMTWVTTEMRTLFLTQEVIRYVEETLGYGKRYVYDALNQLVKSGKLKKGTKKGKYIVLDKRVSDIE